MRYHFFMQINWFSLKCTLSRKREKGVPGNTRQSVCIVVALPEPVDQGKGGKREAFPSRTRGSGRDAMEIRYTEASVINNG